MVRGLCLVIFECFEDSQIAFISAKLNIALFYSLDYSALRLVCVDAVIEFTVLGVLVKILEVPADLDRLHEQPQFPKPGCVYYRSARRQGVYDGCTCGMPAAVVFFADSLCGC